ncbi:uncharacterized protein LOC122079820 [Macadamia integrifolia]|uniref:uncharacterized protein LOC122079820 n=1 Tax=Macadamia integrifolia TaxID=60698 RepID=UPI001C4E740C|nr:uncharacterized protein LOC122079820 [Macadamia integrifolia]
MSIFGWRMIHGKLPSNEVVRWKGITLTSKCNLCGVDEESLDLFNIGWSPPLSIPMLLQWWKKVLNLAFCKEAWVMGIVIMADSIWKERNLRRHDEVQRHSRYVCISIIEKLKRCKPNTKGAIRSMANMMCCRKLGLMGQGIPDRPILDVHWCKPQVNWVKLNFDGSSIGNPGLQGIGRVFRDCLRRVLGSYKIFMGVTGVFHAEMEGLMEGLIHARDLGFNQLWVEPDSSSVVMWVQQRKIPWFAAQQWAFLKPYLDGINWKISHIFREGNSIVDFLARDAAKTGISRSNVNFLGHVVELLSRDATGRLSYRFC